MDGASELLPERGPEASSSSIPVDVEKGLGQTASYLRNNKVNTLEWQGLTVTVKDRSTKQPREILSDGDGVARAGMNLVSSLSLSDLVSCFHFMAVECAAGTI